VLFDPPNTEPGSMLFREHSGLVRHQASVVGVAEDTRSTKSIILLASLDAMIGWFYLHVHILCVSLSYAKREEEIRIDRDAAD
jgi:hypothetical protein